MINERMLEFLSLAEILNNWNKSNEIYDLNKVYDKYKSLAKELLSPYVINKNSKE